MLFSSPEFLFAFLPAVLAGYYLLLHRFGGKTANLWLTLASLFFYAWWKPAYLPLILASILGNYFVGKHLIQRSAQGIQDRLWLTLGIGANLSLLAYYKYAWFAVETLASLVGSPWRIEALLLPLAISFFTFQQIAFLVDASKGEIKTITFTHYTLFVAFFPQLIAGPIVHHREMMPQFERPKGYLPGWVNIEQGLRIFLIGLAKKILIADTLARFADLGWSQSGELTFFDAWATTLAYTFQLYFDFSGYSDMAVGAARFFGIHLPVNFNSPYRATNLQDFWARWHMTLSRWLRDYLYIPLGGNRKGNWKTWRNLLLTFLIGGIWHGAGWTFIIWGLLHGLGSVLHRLWARLGIPLPSLAGWAMTFLFVHIGWVFFRAPDLGAALEVLKAMGGAKGTAFSADFARVVNYLVDYPWLKGNENWDGLLPMRTLNYLFFAAGIAFFARNSMELTAQAPFRRPLLQSILFSLLALACILSSVRALESPFLYFNF
jgi:D-alanyl-lipoteichoic acid acyltransferase DltB (MBOAT superfamily)